MKKLFTLALVLSVALAGSAQVKKMSSKDVLKTIAQEQVVTGEESFENVGSFPNMTRSEADLDYTTYDWQTNTASKNWTMTFPDGCVGFSYTIATDDSYSDRGTNVAIYNPTTDEWWTSVGKVEDHKTGFGCAARYGENGVIVVSRNPSTFTCEVYIIEDKDNLPSGDLAPVYVLPGSQTEYNPHFPAVMCTGENHDHIHILVTALNQTINDQSNPFFYFRSMDGGQTWEEYLTIDYLGRDYAPTYGSGQDAYFMENNGGNDLSIVVNTRRGDGAVLTSHDEGNTWERTVYYHHPGIDVDFGSDGLGYMYPRWSSALWGNDGKLHVAYEFGGATGDASSTSYYPGVGGVGYWNSEMPYKGDSPTYGADPTNPMPPVNGQAFIMDSAYLYQDIYSSLWYWSNATHEMWDEYIGYLPPLDSYGQPEDPYNVNEFNIEDFTLHGSYNCGICAMPVLMTTPNQDLLVALWIAMDENTIDGSSNHFFKLFTRASLDNGATWTPMHQLTATFMYQYSECVYPQAAITNNQLVIACQMDAETDTYIIGSGGDTDPYDNYYQGMTFDLNDLFGYDAVEETVVAKNTTMTLYPNPASETLNITLNQDEDVVIYNTMGQAVKSFKGFVGLNTVDLSGLNAGVYFINAGTASQKLVVK